MPYGPPMLFRISYRIAISWLTILLACAGPATQLPASAPTPPTTRAPSADTAADAALIYPRARRDEASDLFHGVQVDDPYRWLEDGESREVGAWLTAEDHLARAELGRLPQRDALRKRLEQLMYYDAVHAPLHRKTRSFWQRKHADREKLVVYVKEDTGGEPRVLLDPNAWSADGTRSLGGFWPSWDGKLVAYAVKANNADEATLHVLEVDSGRELPDVIAGAKYAQPSWTPDGTGFYYVWVPVVAGDVTVPNRPGFAELRFHHLGDDPAKDALVHERTGDPSTFLEGFVTRNGHYLFALVQHGWNATDVYFRDLRKKQRAWTTLTEGLEATFAVEVHDDRFYLLTNFEAPRYRVLAADPKKPAQKHWRELIAEDPEAAIDSVSLVGGQLAVVRLRKAVSELSMVRLNGERVRDIALPGRGNVRAVMGLADEDVAYFSFSSFFEPGLVTELTVSTGAVREWSRVSVPFDRDAFAAEQVLFPSKDGTMISMFVVHRKDVAPGQGARAVLTGYGGFSISLTPEFSSARIAWLELGGVWAVPNLRGGGEYGEAWHRAGMLLHKQNVFDDFIAAARYLVDQGWTTSDKLGIYGRSNGGLLVGAAMTQAPSLFGAVVCGVPLLDMVRYDLSGAGKTWISEYGSSGDPRQFAALHAYSPYHHVVSGMRYPALLMLGADHDDRVDPMHARKMTARLQATAPERPVLLRVERNSGHGGADLVRQKLEEAVDMYSFFLAELGSASERGLKGK